MKIIVRAAVCTFFLCISLLLSAQNPNLLLNYQKSDSLFVCGTDTFSITIQNNGGNLAASATLTLTLPNGIQYQPGSVSGATQQNISNLQIPVFSLPAIQTNGTAVVKILLTADCAAADVLDAGGLFLANIAVAAPNASASVTTSSIPVETGLLLIESVDSLLMAGERFDTLYRKICIKNTRLGKIGSLHFQDLHQAGFSVHVPTAETETDAATVFSAEFDPAIFTTTGNGDGWLDIGESICFTERIVISDCGIPEYLNTSLLRVGWGCGPQLCRFDSVYANIKIKRSQKVPDLVMTKIWNPPTNYCAANAATLGVKIVNQGLGDAQNVSFSFKLFDSFDKLGMVAGSFRTVASNGTVTPITPNLSFNNSDFNCGATVSSQVLLTVPFVAAKDSMELLFDMLSCAPDCEDAIPQAYVEFFYQKACPVNGFVSDSLNIVPSESWAFATALYMNLGVCMESGVSYPVSGFVGFNNLDQPGGFVHLEFDLPHGIQIDPNCNFRLAGVTPSSATTTPAADGGTLAHLVFALPFATDSAIMEFCLLYTCDTSIVCQEPPKVDENGSIEYELDCRPCFAHLVERAYWTPALNTPYACAIGDCADVFLAIDPSCSPLNGGGGSGDTSGTVVSLPAGYRWKMEVARTNYGLRDQDDDRRADDGSQARPEEIRLDRYLPGDTSRVTYCGVLDSGVIHILPRFIFHEILKSDVGGVWGNDDFKPDIARLKFTDFHNLRFLRDSMRIRYANGDQVAFTLNDLVDTAGNYSYAIELANTFPPAVVDVIVTQQHYFNDTLALLFAKGLLPKPTLEAGDSIFFYTDFKMDMNYLDFIQAGQDPKLIGFRTAMNHSGGKYAGNKFPFKRMQYSGYVTYNSSNTFSIKPCENSQEAKKYRHATRIARENLFPFEVRPLARITDYLLSVPDGPTAVEVQLTYLALQDSVPWLSNLALPFSQTPGQLDVDFSPVFSQPIDEGFVLGTRTTFGPDCHFSEPDTSRQLISTQYNMCLHDSFPLLVQAIHNNIGYFANHPELSIVTIDSVVYSPTRPFDIDFSLKNPVISPAPFPWLTVQTPSGLTTDIQLFKMPQNQAIAPQNGFYQLPNVGGFTQAPYRLSGKNLSCETDTLILIFGWDCAPVTDLSQSSCYRDTYIVRLNLEKPELELNILQEPPSITLCDTSDYFEFEIYNAKTGYTYDLFGSAKLPDGMRVVSGTSQLFYPPVGAWVNIADPALLPGNLFRWDVSNSQAFIQANGLPGVNLDPQNTVRIRFKTLAECGFVANTQNIYGTYGQEPCGRTTNILNKPGERIQVEGLSPTYGVVVGLQAVGNQASVCGGEQEFSVQITLLGTPSAGDSAVVTLPPGANLLAGSYQPGINAPAEQPTLTSGGFRVALPILTGGGNMQFTFKVVFGPGTSCIDQTLSVQTRVRTQAFCQSLGAPCDVYVSTGEYSLQLHIEHPELVIDDVQASLQDNSGTIAVDVYNIGDYAAITTTVQLWQDVDGNHVVSAGDVLLQTITGNGILNPGGTLTVNGDLNLTLAQRCGLLVVLPAAENCTCSAVVFPLETLQVLHTTIAFCDLNPVVIAVDSLDGFQYQWQNNAGIDCLDCATTFFTPDSSSSAGQTVVLSLLETSGNCTVTHQFTLTFGAIASISVNNATICTGQEVTLSANPSGATYFWEGSAIQTPGAQSQTLFPTTSATYALTVTLPNGCTATATAMVAVLPSDTILLPEIKACEGSTVQVFGNSVQVSNLIYQLSLPKSNGCDSTLIQPVAVLPKSLTESNQVFCAGDTLLVFDSIMVTTSTQVCKSYQGLNGCDSTHCINTTAVTLPNIPEQDTIFSHVGEEIVLGGVPGFSTYTWNPEPDPPCFNCPTLTFTINAEGYYEYHLTLKDNNGCAEEVIWRVFIFPPCDPQNVQIPNAFTPNGDGANDVFRPIATEGEEVFGRLTIYDRWGEKVYENRGNVYWDGTIDGVPASSDVYVYIVEVECENQLVPRVGEVTLLR